MYLSCVCVSLNSHHHTLVPIFINSLRQLTWNQTKILKFISHCSEFGNNYSDFPGKILKYSLITECKIRWGRRRSVISRLSVHSAIVMETTTRWNECRTFLTQFILVSPASLLLFLLFAIPTAAAQYYPDDARLVDWHSCDHSVKLFHMHIVPHQQRQRWTPFNVTNNLNFRLDGRRALPLNMCDTFKSWIHVVWFRW